MTDKNKSEDDRPQEGHPVSEEIQPKIMIQ